MTPLEKFGALIYRAWNEQDHMNLDGGDIQQLALKAGVIFEAPYSIEIDGEYLRDAWGVEEGELCNRMTPGIAEIIDQAHAK